MSGFFFFAMSCPSFLIFLEQLLKTGLICDTERMQTCHSAVLLLQCGGVDDASEEASVADCVLLPLVAFIQQLVVQQEQLAAQRVKLVQRSRAWGGHDNNHVINTVTQLTNTYTHINTILEMRLICVLSVGHHNSTGYVMKIKKERCEYRINIILIKGIHWTKFQK